MAVSIAAGVSAITSAIPSLHVNRVVLSLGFIGMLMLGNLRGLRESTKLFGIPVYAFVGVMFALVMAGAYQVHDGHGRAGGDRRSAAHVRHRGDHPVRVAVGVRQWLHRA